MAVATTALILGSLIAAQTTKGVIDARSAAKGVRKTANFEATGLEEQADDALVIGQEAESRSRASTRQLAGAQKASQAAQGLDITTGSPADVIATDEKIGEYDARQIRLNAMREAMGLRKQAQLVRMGGRATAQGYNNQATSTLLSGATAMYDVYSRYGQTIKPSVPRGTSSTGQGGYHSGTARR